MARATLTQLLDKSKQRTATGGLADASPTLPQLAEQAGIAPPISAVGAGLLGANPDQQKMARTPAQTNNALKIAQSPGVGGTGQTLQDAQRSGPSGQLTEQEKKDQAGAQQLGGGGGLSTLADRVQSLIHGAFQQKQPAQLNYTVADTIQDLSSLPTTTVDAFRTQLQAWLSNPTDMNLLNAASTTIGKAIDPAQVGQYIAQANTVIGTAGAAAVQNAGAGKGNFNIGYLLDQKQIGIPEDQLVSTLGVDKDTLRNMTLPELSQKIATVEQQEFQNIQKLQGMLSDPGVSTAERQAARDQLRTYSETGFRTAADEMSALKDSVQKADVVQFGGNTYTVEKLLDDGNVNRIIASYIGGADTDPQKQQLKAKEPEFTAWLDANKQAFDTALSAQGQFQTGLKQYGDIQTFNRGLGNVGGAAMNENVASALMPGYDHGTSLQAQKIDPSRFGGAYQAITQDPAKGAVIVSKLNALDPETPGHLTALKEIGKLSKDQVLNLGLDKPNGKFEKYLNLQAGISKLANAKDSADIIAAAFGEQYRNENPQQLASDIQLEHAYSALGLDNNYETLSSYLTPTGGLDLEKIRTDRLQKMNSFHLGDLAQDSTDNLPPAMGESLTMSKDSTGTQLFHILGNAARDGTVTADEAKKADISQFTDNIDTTAPFYQKNPEIAEILEERGESDRVHKYFTAIPGLEQASTLGQVLAGLKDAAGSVATNYPDQESRTDALNRYNAAMDQLNTVYSEKALNNPDLHNDLVRVRTELNAVTAALAEKVHLDKLKKVEPGITAAANPTSPAAPAAGGPPTEGFQTGPNGLIWGPNGEPTDISKADQTGLDNTPGAQPAGNASDVVPASGNASAPGVESGPRKPEKNKLSDLQTALPSILSDPAVLSDPKKWPTTIPADTRKVLEGVADAVNRFATGLSTDLSMVGDNAQKLMRSMGVEGSNLKDTITNAANKARQASVDKLPPYLKSLPSNKLAGALQFNADGKIDPAELRGLMTGLDASQLNKMVGSIPDAGLKNLVTDRLRTVNLENNLSSIASGLGLKGINTTNQLTDVLNSLRKTIPSIPDPSKFPINPAQAADQLKSLASTTKNLVTKNINALVDSGAIGRTSLSSIVGKSAVDKAIQDNFISKLPSVQDIMAQFGNTQAGQEAAKLGADLAANWKKDIVPPAIPASVQNVLNQLPLGQAMTGTYNKARNLMGKK